MTRRAWLLFVALGIIWGFPYLFIKISVREVSPALLVLVRTGGGALLLAPVLAARGGLRAALSRWKPLLVYSCVEIAVPWYLLFNAEKRISSSLAGLLIACVPIAGAVLATVTRTDRLDARRVSGLLLGLCGVAALVGFDVGRSSILAALSLGIVAIGYALGPWILSKYLSGLSGVSVVTCSLAVCAVIYSPFAAFSLPTRSLSGSVVASMVALTVLCTAVAFVGLFLLIGEVGAMRSNVITYVNPAVAVLLGVSVLGERFGIGTGIGFVLILSGSFLSTRPLLADQTGPSKRSVTAVRSDKSSSVVTSTRWRANSLWAKPSTTCQSAPSEATGNPKTKPSGAPYSP